MTMDSRAFDEQLAIMSHRLETVIAEAERLETELAAIGQLSPARDLAHIALDVRLVGRSLARLSPHLEPPSPFRPPLQSLRTTA